MGKFLNAGIPLVIAICVVATWLIGTWLGLSVPDAKMVTAMAPLVIAIVLPVLYGLTDGGAFDNESDEMLIAVTTAVYAAMICGWLAVWAATSILFTVCMAVLLLIVGFALAMFVASELCEDEWIPRKLLLPVGLVSGSLFYDEGRGTTGLGALFLLLAIQLIWTVWDWPFWKNISFIEPRVSE
jgi:hypothetical protein